VSAAFAARAGASDCAGFAPNKTQTRLALTALSLAPCHLHKPPFSSFHVPSVFVRWRSSEGQKQAGNGRKEKTMKLEEINNRTKDAVSYLVEALESRTAGQVRGVTRH
jgi:hypothetical protein